MDEKRPLPDSDELANRRRNQRLVRWTTASVAVMLIVVAVLYAIMRWLEG